jgi:hypothetical protein
VPFVTPKLPAAMSALGYERTSGCDRTMSALPSKADLKCFKAWIAASDRALTTNLFHLVIHDGDLSAPTTAPQESRRTVTALLSSVATRSHSFLKAQQQEFTSWACLWSDVRRRDGLFPRADTSNPGYSAAPLYFSAAPIVHTAGRGMSGLSKTHGFAIPTNLNVNSWGERRPARLFKMAANYSTTQAEGTIRPMV